MSEGGCPECGATAADHSPDPRFWMRPGIGCDLLPRGVTERIEQYESEQVSP